MEKKIRDIFELLGYYFDSEGNLINDEIDSVEFINIIIALEEEFAIEIPEKFLAIEFLESTYSIGNMIAIAREKENG